MRLRLAPGTLTHEPRSDSGRETRLSGRSLLLARVGWMAVATLALCLFVVGIPAQYSRLSVACPTTSCSSGQLNTVSVRALQGLGLSLSFFSLYALTLIVLFAIAFGGVAALIFWRRRNDRTALFVSITLVTFGLLTFSGVASALAQAVPVLWLPVTCLIYLGSVCFVLFLFLFPNGRFVPRWTRWVALAWILQTLPSTFFPDASLISSSEFTIVGIVVWAVALVTVIYSHVYRYRHVSTALQRHQTKWVVFGISVAAVGLLGALVVLDIFNSRPSTSVAMAVALLADALVYGAIICVPVSIGIAMLRSHLFDVDLLINRALVYAALTASVVGVYVLVIGSLNVVFQTHGNVLIAFVATGAVAVLFQPLRERLQRAVNHLTYGLRDEPYAVISQMTQRLEAAVAPEAVLKTIAETVAQALKLPYAALALIEADSLTIAASYGTPNTDLLRIPLTYHAVIQGELQVASRTGGDQWTAADHRLLGELARHAGAAAHAVHLTRELQRSNANLIAARERMVTAREEERRRLRRDLHDGLGPSLAALTLKIGAARKLLARDEASAEVLLAELGDDIQATIGDIRRLVYGLRPPTLDELGLVGAIRELASQYTTRQGDRLRVDVSAPDILPALPAAVEVAAYRITQEALTNVARHAQAHVCTVAFTLSDDHTLQLVIADDGVGLPSARPHGVGLSAMRERAAELGGTCAIEPASPAGTRILARLPMQRRS